MARNSVLVRLCLCCITRQRICCMPLQTTDMRAMTAPRTLCVITKSVTVLPDPALTSAPQRRSFATLRP